MATAQLAGASTDAAFEQLLDTYFRAPPTSAVTVKQQPATTSQSPDAIDGHSSGAHSSNSNEVNNSEAFMSPPPVLGEDMGRQMSFSGSDTAALLEYLSGNGALITFPSPDVPQSVAVYAFNSQPAKSKDSKDTQSVLDSKIEKSRSAQRRFRERRKEQLNSLQDQFEQMSAQLEQLSTQNSDLKQRSRVLQRLLKVQESQQQVLDANYEPDKDKEGCPHDWITNLDMEPHPEFSRAHILESFCPTLAALARTKADVKDAKEMTPEKMIDVWKTYLQKVSVHLLNSDANPGNMDIVHEMSKLTCNVTWICKHVSVLNSTTMNKVMCFDLERLAPAAAPAGHWDNVVALIGFNDQQRADMRTCLEVFQQRLGKIASDMQEVVTAARALGYTQQDHSSTWNATSDTDTRLTQRLEEVLKRQHEIVMQAKGFFFGMTLNCLQFARTAVYSYPFFPDAIGIMEAATGFTITPPPASAAAHPAAPSALPIAGGLQMLLGKPGVGGF